MHNCSYKNFANASTGLEQLSIYCYDYNQSKKFITAKKSACNLERVFQFTDARTKGNSTMEKSMLFKNYGKMAVSEC